MPSRAPIPTAILAAFLIGCATEPSLEEPGPLAGGDLSILFIGNSLTYANFLPDLVQTVAEASGRTLARRVHAWPNYSLEDHWQEGAEAVVLDARAEFVVLQQGPSSLPANRVHLATWATTFAPAVREAGGEPALFMVWPERSRTEAFDAVRDSYQAAAEAADALFIPAGEAWREVWRQDAEIELYGPDGFHPDPLGSIVAALTIYAVLSGDDVRDLPDVLEPTSPGLPSITLPSGTGALVREAVHRTVTAWPAR
jgi:hypothetical protein